MMLAEASGFMSFLPQLAPQAIYTISFVVSIALFCIFFFIQHHYFGKTKNLVGKYTDFFAKDNDYNFSKEEKKIDNVAHRDTYLHELIEDINKYLSTCKGTASFGIIQNKTERRLTMRYDEATADMSFPTHLGLMGTFVGVFIGLFFFLWASSGPDGITDEAIHSLITGVLVSMSTSFVGLYMSIRMTAKASKARTLVDEDKNDFYEFVQNDVMGHVDTSLSDALASLHETVATFEPQFSSVIEGFKEAFKECTDAFGDDFRESVSTLVTAVNEMGENMDVVNKNVALLKELIKHMSSGEMVRYMRSFSDAADHIQVVTSSLEDFERARRMMLAAAQESLNIQKSYNTTLNVPLEIATKINTILSRITRFEDNINRVGENLGQINMVSDRQVQALDNIISAIREKHKVALDFGSTANTKLEAYFNDQINQLKNMHGRYIAAFTEICKQYEELVQDHIDEIGERHEAFKAHIDKTFDLEECRKEFGELKKIHVIESNTRKIEEKTMSASTLSKKLNDIEKAIDKIEIPESKGFLGIGGSKSKSEDKTKPPVKTGTAKPYTPPEKPEKSAKELLREMEKDKDQPETHTNSSENKEVPSAPVDKPATQQTDKQSDGDIVDVTKKIGFLARLLGRK